jgi:excisionase family DNA binding protein
MADVWDRTYVTPEEVAKRFRINPRTVRRWAADGRLEAVRIGRQWRIPVNALERLASPVTVNQDGSWLEVCRRTRAATPPGEDSVPLLRTLREGRAER